MSDDILCLSHLRWGFVYQRPNHLMARAARNRRVFFVEEPVHDAGPPALSRQEVGPNLVVCTPRLPPSCEGEVAERAQRELLLGLLRDEGVQSPVLWFYTPMACPLVADVPASVVVYDCMDELSAFRGAPPELVERERALFARADLVFTGGQSLYESKRQHHREVHAFPSSVDARHFARASAGLDEPSDQASIARPRAGYFGVIDERIDLELLARLADARPDVQIVMVGPVVKIDPATLPRRPNLHYLGGKSYDALPDYISGWDVALMPFALNEATRYISPTKTLEYLAAGKAVVSTAIRDVVEPYGHAGVVRIADVAGFPDAVGAALAPTAADERRAADSILARTSWDSTWTAMNNLLTRAAARATSASSAEKGPLPCSTT